MKETTQGQPVRFQVLYEQLLAAGALALAEFHMLLLLFQVVIPIRPLWDAEMNAGLVLLALLVLYLLITALVFPGTLGRVRQALGRMRSYEYYYMFGLLLWYLLICTLRQMKGGEDYFDLNARRIFLHALNCLILFPMPAVLGPQKAAKVFRAMLHPLAASYTLFSMWALWQYQTMTDYTFPATEKVLRMTSSYSLSIGLNRNATGVYACLMAGICIYMLANLTSRLRWLYLPALLVHVTVILLSNSRTSLIGSALMFACTLFMLVFRGGQKDRKGLSLPRILGGLAVALCFCVLYFKLRDLIFVTLNEVTHYTESVEDVARDITDVSGRTLIWRAAVMLITSSPFRFLTGVTPAKVKTLLYSMGQYPKSSIPHCHNMFLQMACAFGVPAMLAYTVFLGFIAFRCLRLLFTRRKYVIRNAWAVPMLILCLTAIDMMECFTVLREYTTTPVFYLFCGYVVMLDRTAQEEPRVTA